MQSFHPIWHHNNKGQLYWMDMERVIGAALAGDQQAIAKLYNAYSHKVLGICYIPHHGRQHHLQPRLLPRDFHLCQRRRG